MFSNRETSEVKRVADRQVEHWTPFNKALKRIGVTGLFLTLTWREEESGDLAQAQEHLLSFWCWVVFSCWKGGLE